MLTYDNSAFIRELYRDFCLCEWDLQYGMNNVNSQNAPKGKELLISNFALAKSQDLAEQMQASQNRISKEKLVLDFDKQIVV